MSTTPTAPSKRSDPGGFTLMEMLIAIIAVLVAIAIPTFNTQLERAREAHDVYVMRQAMTLAVTSYCGGIEDESSARAAGLKWWSNGGGEQDNAADVYDPTTGKFSPIRSTDAKAYGKGAKLTTGSEYSFNGEHSLCVGYGLYKCGRHGLHLSQGKQ